MNKYSLETMTDEEIATLDAEQIARLLRPARQGGDPVTPEMVRAMVLEWVGAIEHKETLAEWYKAIGARLIELGAPFIARLYLEGDRPQEVEVSNGEHGVYRFRLTEWRVDQIMDSTTLTITLRRMP